MEALCLFLGLYRIILQATVILSWIHAPHDALRPVVAFIYAITEPILRPIRPLIPPLRVGAAKVDVTPSQNELPKNGYGILDRLYARAIVLEPPAALQDLLRFGLIFPEVWRGGARLEAGQFVFGPGAFKDSSANRWRAC